MPDPFHDALQLIAEAGDLPATDGIRYLFDAYRTSSPEYRDALVLALIGEVSTAAQRRRVTTNANAEAA